MTAMRKSFEYNFFGIHEQRKGWFGTKKTNLFPLYEKLRRWKWDLERKKRWKSGLAPGGGSWDLVDTSTVPFFFSKLEKETEWSGLAFGLILGFELWSTNIHVRGRETSRELKGRASNKPNRKKEPKKEGKQAWTTSYEFHIKC
jgi:hypothetical protein